MDMPASLHPPEGAAFYRPPEPLPDGEHGDPIWWRPLSGPAALAQATTSELVLHRSTAIDGTPVGVSGIIALPHAVRPGAGIPVISWAHGTLGSADVCAPSRDTADPRRISTTPRPMACSMRSWSKAGRLS
jgi:hypothetical protein